MRDPNDPYVRADMALRGALMWAGVGDWGEPQSLLYAAEGAAQKIRDLEEKVRDLQQQRTQAHKQIEDLRVQINQIQVAREP